MEKETEDQIPEAAAETSVQPAEQDASETEVQTTDSDSPETTAETTADDLAEEPVVEPEAEPGSEPEATVAEPVIVPTTDSISTAKPKKRRRKIGLIDGLIFVVLAIIIIFLLKTLLGQLSLKHEVAGARVVSDRVVADIAKQDGKDVHALGNTKFQKAYSTTDLTFSFNAVKAHTKSKPSVDNQTVVNSKTGQTVSVIYKYPDNKFFVRIISTKLKGSDKWQLVNLSANSTEKPLLTLPTTN